MENREPLAGVQTGVTEPSTRSVAEATQLTEAPPCSVASTTWSPGRLRTGAVVSWIVMPKALVALLPALSCVEQVTVVVPSAKTVADAGVQVTLSVPSTMSVAFGVS